MACRRFSLGWLRRVRRWYWHHADAWPLSALRRYVKALLILSLWVLAAIGLFYLLRFLLPDTLKISLGGEDTGGISKESIAFLGSLLTALIGFGLQQWKGQEEEERRCQEEENEVLSLIEEGFPDLLQRNPSEGAYRYIEFRKKGGTWQHSRIRTRLEEVWEKWAPPELQRAVALMEKFPEAKDFTLSERFASLRWVYSYLDENWRSRVANELLNLGFFPEWTEKKLWTVLGIWPDVTLGKGLISAPDCWSIRGLRCLGLDVNPFGSEKAETDAHLLKTQVIPSWWGKLASSSAGLFFTIPGGGRTTAALFLARNGLDKQTVFPIYCRMAVDRLSLGDLARWMAQTIARYIALSPFSFTRCSHSAKQAIKCLLCGYLPRDPLLYLQEAGLSSVGEGGKVMEEFRAHLAGPSRSALSQTDLLTLLGEARLSDFPRTLILADVQGVVENEDVILSFYGLMDALAQVGIALQVFLAVSPSSHLQEYGALLDWSREDLYNLLRCRLRLLSSDDTLDAWCDLREWSGPSAEERLIAAAGKSPRMLIRLGNALLKHIGKTGRRLTPQDLDDVLGPVP